MSNMALNPAARYAATSIPAALEGGLRAFGRGNMALKLLQCSLIYLALAAPIRAAGPEKAGIEWVRLPGGTMRIHRDKQPMRSLTIRAFEISKSPVTNRQYRACVKAGACKPSHEYGRALDGDEQPVIGVTWRQARAFSEWAGGRLPSEAEWEYAARSGGKDYRYPWGNEHFSCGRAVAYDKALGGFGCGRKATWPVCSKPKGNSEQGVCDLGGNVNEWVEDLAHRGHFEKAPSDGAAWVDPEGQFWSGERVIRGRAWDDENSDAVQDREWEKPDAEYDTLGFRPARSGE